MLSRVVGRGVAGRGVGLLSPQSRHQGGWNPQNPWGYQQGGAQGFGQQQPPQFGSFGQGQQSYQQQQSYPQQSNQFYRPPVQRPTNTFQNQTQSQWGGRPQGAPFGSSQGAGFRPNNQQFGSPRPFGDNRPNFGGFQGARPGFGGQGGPESNPNWVRLPPSMRPILVGDDQNQTRMRIEFLARVRPRQDMPPSCVFCVLCFAQGADKDPQSWVGLQDKVLTNLKVSDWAAVQALPNGSHTFEHVIGPNTPNPRTKTVTVTKFENGSYQFTYNSTGETNGRPGQSFVVNLTPELGQTLSIVGNKAIAKYYSHGGNFRPPQQWQGQGQGQGDRFGGGRAGAE